MIIRVETASHGTIRGMVFSSMSAVRFLRSLAEQGIKCVRWQIERDVEKGGCD